MSIKEDFERDGVVVVRGAIAADGVKMLQDAWREFYNPERTVAYNKVAIAGPFGQVLDSLPHYPSLLNIVEQVFGHDIALYNYRFVVKDKHARDAVFLHQDTPYHVGWPTKASMFVALSHVAPHCGGMVFYRGTHKYGYLGDAGEISFLTPHLYSAFAPELWPGDAALMHSALWHESTPHMGDDRILADIIYQPTNDPSGIALLRGQWRCTPQPWLRQDNLFVRSRTSRLRELQAKVDAK